MMAGTAGASSSETATADLNLVMEKIRERAGSMPSWTDLIRAARANMNHIACFENKPFPKPAPAPALIPARWGWPRLITWPSHGPPVTLPLPRLGTRNASATPIRHP